MTIPWNENATFVKAIAVVFLHEGGFCNLPGDSGGPTKFGISQRSYPNLDIINLTRDAAADIYYRDWWLKGDYDALPADLAIKLMDLAVVAPKPAYQCVQRALRACGIADIVDDGVIGPKTKAAINTVDLKCLLAAFKSEFAGYCRMISIKRQIEGLPSFEAGWLARAYS